MAPRKKSLVWLFYKRGSNNKVQCQLCMGSVVHTGQTTNLLRHLRTKHPAEVASIGDREKELIATNEATPVDTSNTTSSDNICSVEVGCSETEGLITVNEADFTSAINGILKASVEVEVVAGQSEQEDGKVVVRSPRKWSAVWKCCKRLDDRYAQCLLCLKKIQHHSSTGNLHRHLSKRHPEDFARLGERVETRPPHAVLHTPKREDLLNFENSRDVFVATHSDADIMGACEGEVRVLERERELIEALRSVQQQEVRALEQQRELLEMLRQAHAREKAAERQSIETLRRSQEQEAVALRREREEVQREREALRKEREELRASPGDGGRERGLPDPSFQGAALSENADA